MERRLSLPSGYRLVTDLSSLPCSPASLSPRRRKDNLVTRGGPVRVRQVPIILEEDGEEVESSTSSLSSASIVTQSGRGSLPSNTAQQANKVKLGIVQGSHSIKQGSTQHQLGVIHK